MSIHSFTNHSPLIWHASPPEAVPETIDKIKKRWTAANLDERILSSDSDTAKKILDLRVHQHHRTWGDLVKWDHAQNQTVIKIENQWRAARPFLSDLKCEWNEWTSISNPQSKWCCDSYGFHNRSGSDWNQMPQTADLSQTELAFARARAAQSPSPLSTGERSCILEVVSGESGFSFPALIKYLLSGLSEVYLSPLHPFVRLVDDQGKVHSVGFWPNTAFSMDRFMSSEMGRYFASDPYETMPVVSRSVTRIAIDRNQFDQLKQSIEEYKRAGKVFNLRHNCTAFVTDILHRVGFKVDTRIWIHDFIARCTPVFLQNLAAPVKKVVDFARKYFETYFIEPLSEALYDLQMKVKDIARYFFGEFFPMLNTTPFLGNNPHNLLRYPLPKRILDWQNSQSSTLIYKRASSFKDQYKPPVTDGAAP